MSATEFIEFEVEVLLTVTTTREDIDNALSRSGIVIGALIGEALIDNVSVYDPLNGSGDSE